MMFSWLLSYAKRATMLLRQEDSASKRALEEHLAHQRWGLSKATSLLLSPPSPPRNAETLQLLRSKPRRRDGETYLKHVVIPLPD